MRYKKGIDSILDQKYKNSANHGMKVKLSEDVLFYRKMFHWEYIKREEIKSIYRKIEEVISHTSCCAENMDIERLIVTKKDGETLDIHVCDGERRTAERLYSDLMKWDEISFGKPEE